MYLLETHQAARCLRIFETLVAHLARSLMCTPRVSLQLHQQGLVFVRAAQPANLTLWHLLAALQPVLPKHESIGSRTCFCTASAHLERNTLDCAALNRVAPK